MLLQHNDNCELINKEVVTSNSIENFIFEIYRCLTSYIRLHPNYPIFLKVDDSSKNTVGP